MSNFELKINPAFLKMIQQNVDTTVDSLATKGAFEAYNRGGGPAGNYDRHYDRSTGFRAENKELELV